MTHFEIIWDNGYVVQVKQADSLGYSRYYPLRKFAEQGDAKCFRDYDCPGLSDIHIRGLIKQYKPDMVYKRIKENRFIPYAKWVERISK